MLIPWPDQYWATSEPTIPLKLLAVKTGACARTLAFTVRVRAVKEEPMPVEPDPLVVVIVADGVPVPMPLLEPASLVAEGVPVPVPLMAPVSLVAEGVPNVLPEPAIEKACHGMRTWFADVAEPVPVLLLVAEGVPVVIALLVAEGVPVVVEVLPDEELLEPLLFMLTTT